MDAPTPQEFLELARFWAKTRCSLWLHRLQPEHSGSPNDLAIEHATERLAGIAAEVEEGEVEAIVAEVEDRHRSLFGDTIWQILKQGTPEQRQALADEWARRPTQGVGPKDDGPVEGILMHHVTSGAMTRGWIHTHGMDRFGLPELEIRNVPSYFVDAAVRVLREVCRYMNQPGVVVKIGETMATSPKTAFRFVRAEPIPGNEDHYQVERWQIVEIEPSCEACAGRNDGDDHGARQEG